MKKIVFTRIVGHSRYPYSGAINMSDGMPTSSGDRIENLLERYDYTGNKGNMFHGEAPARIFECNRARSCYLNVESLYEAGWTLSKINKELSSRFDLAVFSMANAIRTGFNPGVFTKIIESLEMDFIFLGLGMQESLSPSLDHLHPNLIQFLNLSNKKAKIFAVRGFKTEQWLKNLGFQNAIALGCPSLFVYPQNILNLSTPDPNEVQSAVTGGYINAKGNRAQAIISLFENFTAHYVMQSEMFALRKYFADSKHLYNDATGEINKELLNIVLEKIHNKRMPFTSYRWFQDPSAWRVFVSQMDFYLGDRFHGGVAALQAGVPAIIIAEDQRVIEMTDFFQIPSVSINEVQTSNVKDLVKKYLSREKIQQLRVTYLEKFANFREVMRKNDVQLTVECKMKVDRPFSS